MTAFTALKVMGDYVIGSWAKSTIDEQQQFKFYSLATFTITLSAGLTVLLRGRVFLYEGWRAGRKLHEEMLGRILEAPINTYFDVTPIGRVLNKFSSDLNKVETLLPINFNSFLVLSFQLVQVMIVAAFANYLLVLLFPVFLLLSFCLLKHIIKSIREIARLVATSKSPVISFMSESIQGTSTIRAFKREDEFIE